MGGLDPGQPLKQVCQPVLNLQVFAVSGRVLPDQVDLTNALCEQSFGFGDNRLGPAASIRSAVLRDDTERARVIAAFGNLDVREVPRRRKYTWGQFVVKVRLG